MQGRSHVQVAVPTMYDVLIANVSMTTSNCPDLDEVDILDMDTSPHPSSSSNELTICHPNMQAQLSNRM